LKKCRAVGIRVPILPEIYLPSSYEQLHALLQLIKASKLDEIMKAYENCKDDDTLFQQLVIENGVEMVRQLTKGGTDLVCGVHFCCFNNLNLLQKVLIRLETIGIHF
jgi:5,10-methylenetetrahydrofolate reductase